MRQRRMGSKGRTKGRGERYLRRHPSVRMWGKAMLAETRRQMLFHDVLRADVRMPVIT